MKKICILFAVATLFALTSSSGLERIECLFQQERQSRMYEAKIKELIENLRVQLKNGIPEKNIPPLDPFVMENFHVGLSQPWAEVNWNMTGKIANLLSFNVTNVKFKLVGLVFDFEFLYELIYGQGIYTIDGLLAQLIPVYGGGKFDVKCTGLKIHVNFNLGSTGTGDAQHLYIKKATFGVEMNQFDFSVSGLMEDPALNDLISHLISDSLPSLITNFQSTINQVGSTVIKTAGDEFLKNKTINDILGMLKPQYEPYVIHCGDP